MPTSSTSRVVEKSFEEQQEEDVSALGQTFVVESQPAVENAPEKQEGVCYFGYLRAFGCGF